MHSLAETHPQRTPPHGGHFSAKQRGREHRSFQNKMHHLRIPGVPVLQGGPSLQGGQCQGLQESLWVPVIREVLGHLVGLGLRRIRGAQALPPTSSDSLLQAEGSTPPVQRRWTSPRLPCRPGGPMAPFSPGTPGPPMFPFSPGVPGMPGRPGSPLRPGCPTPGSPCKPSTWMH